ncbi:MAG TPA: sigma-70 family RNA polymerase sigma factor [Verrucomicrobiota bacterium]|nr:sigma-70 family RNA polymerase sigma factor [Verrucomicrobiota bacterium]HRZ35749.1 sigma-70 family RNA polymerase sigma factor [Candidatus Paceibacterota bacterium]
MPTEDIEALDRDDMARLKAGQDAALSSLMERHAAAVFRFLYRMLGDEEDARDLAQETFARVYRSRESFRPEHAFGNWLLTIAGNLARNRMRWRIRHPTVPLEPADESANSSLHDVLPADTPPPDCELQAEERNAAVRHAVWQLPEDLREAIVLCEWQDLAVAEAARIIGTTPKAVESRLYRARRLLREQLDQWL